MAPLPPYIAEDKGLLAKISTARKLAARGLQRLVAEELMTRAADQLESAQSQLQRAEHLTRKAGSEAWPKANTSLTNMMAKEQALLTKKLNKRKAWLAEHQPTETDWQNYSTFLVATLRGAQGTNATPTEPKMLSVHTGDKSEAKGNNKSKQNSQNVKPLMDFTIPRTGGRPSAPSRERNSAPRLAKQGRGKPRNRSCSRKRKRTIDNVTHRNVPQSHPGEEEATSQQGGCTPDLEKVTQQIKKPKKPGPILETKRPGPQTDPGQAGPQREGWTYSGQKTATDFNALGQTLRSEDDYTNHPQIAPLTFHYCAPFPKGTFKAPPVENKDMILGLEQRCQPDVLIPAMNVQNSDIEGPSDPSFVSDTDYCLINALNCSSVLQQVPKLFRDSTDTPLPASSKGRLIPPSLEERKNGSGPLIPFANVNIYDTVNQFYICDKTDLQKMTPSPHRLNVNENNPTSPIDDRNNSLIDSFRSRINTEHAPEPTSVVNLSKRPLTGDEMQVLSLGKGFCPTPGEPDMGEIKSDLDKLHRKCRTKLFFDKIRETSDIKPKTVELSKSSPNLTDNQTKNLAPLSPTHINGGFSTNFLQEKIFRKPTKWGPPTFETFALLNELALNKTQIRAPSKQNLTVHAKRCLKALARDTDVIIKQVDKGGALSCGTEQPISRRAKDNCLTRLSISHSSLTPRTFTTKPSMTSLRVC